MKKQGVGRQVARWMAAGLVAGGIAGTASAQSFSYFTNFAKDNNIYTNLNEQYPHTGTGAPGSGVGTANSTVFFNPDPAAVTAAGYAPNYVQGSNLINNGVGFELASDASGHDFASFAGGGVTVPMNNLLGVTTVYALVAAYNGQNLNATFTNALGTTQTFSNVFVPDFSGGSINNPGTGTALGDQTVFQVHDVGAGGTGNSTTGAYNYYDLTEVRFTLPTAFTAPGLNSVQFTANGYEGLLLGVTAAVPEPSTWALLAGSAVVLVTVTRRRRGLTP